MHLKRVIVPDFRVLKDIDITFEPDLVPRIFPLGSLNGGGKSTLLQLIFTLLHCTGNPDRIPYLQNMLDGFEIDNESGKRDLATIEIVFEKQKIELSFFCCNINYTKRMSEFKSEENRDMFLNFLITKKRLKSVEKEDRPSRKSSYDRAIGRLQFQLLEKNYWCICETNLDREFLLCKFDGIDAKLFMYFIENVSAHTFLTAPITQVFKFLSKSDRGLLFRGGQESCKYYYHLEDARSKLTGFFAYDLLAVNLLIQSFTSARDDDFRIAISNSGKYGDNYHKLIENLEQMLGDKRVNIDPDFAGVSFSTVDSNGNMLQLYPEDLSHGELKRLSLYVWLKFNKMENAIVLMDEVEIALHPDWQYQIVNDLQTWAPNNQYILATHSHELCQALTPAHVKEIEPKLIKK
jgi:predicted ATP-dependent endonuclease of OLD family